MNRKWTAGFAMVALGVLLTSAVWAQPPGGGMRNNPKRQLDRLVMRIGLLEKSGKSKLSPSQAKRMVASINPWRKKSTMTDAQATALQKSLNAVLTSAQKKELENMRPPRREGGPGGPGGRPEGGRRDGGPGEGRAGDRGEGRRGPGGPGGPGGSGGPGGRGSGGAPDKEFRERMEKMRGFMKTYNPFYPPTSYQTVKQMPERMQEGMKRRYAATISVLTQLSKKASRA